jgi:hypothetical protein
MSSRCVSRRARSIAAAVLLLGTAVSCGPMRRGPTPPPTLIIFTNEALDQAAVYMAASGLDFRRIGTVTSGRTDTLTVPSDLSMRGGTVNILARLLARSELPSTGPVTILPGERYQVRLPPDARTLSFLPAGS